MRLLLALLLFVLPVSAQGQRFANLEFDSTVQLSVMMVQGQPSLVALWQPSKTNWHLNNLVRGKEHLWYGFLQIHDPLPGEPRYELDMQATGLLHKPEWLAYQRTWSQEGCYTRLNYADPNGAFAYYMLGGWSTRLTNPTIYPRSTGILRDSWIYSVRYGESNGTLSGSVCLMGWGGYVQALAPAYVALVFGIRSV